MTHKDSMHITVLVVLDSDAFTGGGTAFYGENGNLLVVSQPPSGTAVLWAGNVQHAGLPVVSGTRSVYVGSFSLFGSREESSADLRKQRGNQPFLQPLRAQLDGTDTHTRLAYDGFVKRLSDLPPDAAALFSLPDWEEYTLRTGDRLVVPAGWWLWSFSNNSASIHVRLACATVTAPLADRSPPDELLLQRMSALQARSEGIIIASSSARFIPVHKDGSPSYWNAFWALATEEDAQSFRDAGNEQLLFFTPHTWFQTDREIEESFWRSFGLANTGLQTSTHCTAVQVLSGHMHVFLAPPGSFQAERLEGVVSSGHEHVRQPPGRILEV